MLIYGNSWIYINDLILFLFFYYVNKMKFKKMVLQYNKNTHVNIDIDGRKWSLNNRIHQEKNRDGYNITNKMNDKSIYPIHL